MRHDELYGDSRDMYQDTVANLIYGDSRMCFDTYRGKLVDQACAEHAKGNDALALQFLEQAQNLTYTGLMWQADNGLGD